MAPESPLDIRVVYGASPKGRMRRSRMADLQPRGVPRPRSAWWLILGLANVLTASGFYYGTWWSADRFLYLTVMMRTPLPGVDLEAASALFGVPLAGPTTFPETVSVKTPQVPTPRFTGQTAATVIGATMYGWLTLATVAYCLIALAAGTTLGEVGRRRSRRIWVILAFGMLVMLTWAGFDVWSQYGPEYPPNYLRAGMAGLVVLSALLGMAIGRLAVWFTRCAGIAVILSALGSVAGLSLLRACDAVDPKYASIPFMAMVFAAHSFYGWILLLPIASRVGR